MGIASVTYSVKTNYGAVINLENDLNGESTLADLLTFTKKSLITISQEVLRDAQLRGFDREPLTLVDGRAGKPIEQVSPLGKISFVARANPVEVVILTYESVYNRSRVLSGRYRQSHVLLQNGRSVADTLSGVKAWAASAKIGKKDIFHIVNYQPYARKLENLGVTQDKDSGEIKRKGRVRKEKKTSRTFRQPNGAYHLGYRAAYRKYGKNAKISFVWLTGTDIGVPGVFKRPGRGSGRPYVYPAIRITLREGGTK